MFYLGSPQHHHQSNISSADHEMYLKIAILSYQRITYPPHMLMSVISAHSYDRPYTDEINAMKTQSDFKMVVKSMESQ